jgi:hypothetical protein
MFDHAFPAVATAHRLPHLELEFCVNHRPDFEHVNGRAGRSASIAPRAGPGILAGGKHDRIGGKLKGMSEA